MKNRAQKRVLSVALCAALLSGTCWLAPAPPALAEDGDVTAEWVFTQDGPVVLPVDATGGDLLRHDDHPFTSTLNRPGASGAEALNGALWTAGWAGTGTAAGYWEIGTSSSGWKQLRVVFSAWSDPNGPKAFVLEYSADGETYILAEEYALAAEARSFSVELPEADDLETLSIRMRATGAESVSGGEIDSGARSYLEGLKLYAEAIWELADLPKPVADPLPGEYSSLPGGVKLSPSDPDSFVTIYYTLEKPAEGANPTWDWTYYKGDPIVAELPFTIWAACADWTRTGEIVELAYTKKTSSGGVREPDPPEITVPNDEEDIPLADLPVVFTDIEGHWAEAFIRTLTSKGYVGGVGSDLYAPDREATRAELCQMLRNVFHTPGDAPGERAFSDVRADAWFHDAVMWAAGQKLASGFPDGSFRPGSRIARQDMAVMLSKLCAAKEIPLEQLEPETIFSDGGEIAQYARDAARRLQTGGILSGRESGLYDPRGPVTRAECAAALCRLLAAAGLIEA